VKQSLAIVRKETYSNPTVRLPVWELLARDGRGATIGSTISVVYRGKTLAVTQPQTTIGVDGYVSFRIPITTPPWSDVEATIQGEVLDPHPDDAR